MLNRRKDVIRSGFLWEGLPEQESPAEAEAEGQGGGNPAGGGAGEEDRGLGWRHRPCNPATLRGGCAGGRARPLAGLVNGGVEAGKCSSSIKLESFLTGPCSQLQ